MIISFISALIAVLWSSTLNFHIYSVLITSQKLGHESAQWKYNNLEEGGSLWTIALVNHEMPLCENSYCAISASLRSTNLDDIPVRWIYLETTH